MVSTFMADGWKDYWTEAFDEAKARSPEHEPIEYYVSGRKSKAWPGGEGPDWWAEKGPEFVEQWVAWKKASGLRLWEYPDHETGEVCPAIELEVHAVNPATGTFIKCAIDRVFTDDSDRLYIVDLKTGSMTPPWPLQLALNNLCLRASYADIGGDATFGGYWKARVGGIHGGPLLGGWHDLTRFTDDWLWDQVEKAKTIRDNHLFMANPNNLCVRACGVREFCLAAGGERVYTLSATVTHNQDATPEEGNNNE